MTNSSSEFLSQPNPNLNHNPNPNTTKNQKTTTTHHKFKLHERIKIEPTFEKKLLVYIKKKLKKVFGPQTHPKNSQIGSQKA